MAKARRKARHRASESPRLLYLICLFRPQNPILKKSFQPGDYWYTAGQNTQPAAPHAAVTPPLKLTSWLNFWAWLDAPCGSASCPKSCCPYIEAGISSLARNNIRFFELRIPVWWLSVFFSGSGVRLRVEPGEVYQSTVRPGLVSGSGSELRCACAWGWVMIVAVSSAR